MSREYYEVRLRRRDESARLDCANANQFLLVDEFTTAAAAAAGLRGRDCDITIRRSPPPAGRDADDSGVDLENGNPLDEVAVPDYSDTVSTSAAAPDDSGVDLENGNPLDEVAVPDYSDTVSTSAAAADDSGVDLENGNPLNELAVPDYSDTVSTSAAAAADDSGVDLENGNPLDEVAVPDYSDTPESDVMVDPWSSMESSNSPVTDSPPAAPSPSRPTAAAADACRIPQPHFLDHSPSPDELDELDERSDITNPNFLDDDAPPPPPPPAADAAAERRARAARPARSYRTHLHCGLGASQLCGWPGRDTASVRSFSSAGSGGGGGGGGAAAAASPASDDGCAYSLLSLLSLSPDNTADLSGPLLEMSGSPESCAAMRQAGCVPLLVRLVHSASQPREARERAARALRNIVRSQGDDKAGRREARVWRLLEQVRDYCRLLEEGGGGGGGGEASAEASGHPGQCVAALMKLSFDEEHRHVMCQLGGLQALARLVSADQAAHGSRAEEPACVTMRKYAGMTLTNLTFGDGNNKSLLCSFEDFMVALVEQLQSPNDDMRQVTSAVLRNLSWRADTNSKQVLREVGAVRGLTQAAMTCQKEATLKSVLSALWNLTAHCSLNKVALCSLDGALGFLVDMLSYNSPTKTLAIVENAGGIMRNVSSHIAVREDYRQILRERNCLSVLLQHLKSPSLTVVSNSCGTLWNLSARCPLDQQFLWDQGAVPMLRSLIHSIHKNIAMGSSAALKNLLNSKPGKNHIISLDSTARSMNLPVLPTLGVRKQKALEQELDHNLAETCDNIEPATSPSTTNRDEKNLFSATERQLAMNLERHRMSSSSPLMANLGSQTSLSHSAHLAGYLSCSNTLLKGALVSRSVTGSSSSHVNRSDSRDSVTSTHSDTTLEKSRTAKVPIPTPRSKDVTRNDDGIVKPTEFVKPYNKDSSYRRYPTQPPVPPPRSATDLARNNYTDSNYDVDHEPCDQPVDFSRKYSEAKSHESQSEEPSEDTTVKSAAGKCPKEKKKYPEKHSAENYGDYQETDLDQPTDYSLRYAEHQSETSSDISEPPGPSIHEDTIQHFCTEGTPYETPVIFSTATSISDLRVIGGKDHKNKVPRIIKPNPEVMTQSDEKDTCSVEEPPHHDNDAAIPTSAPSKSEKTSQFDTKFSSGMISPEKPVNYCEEGTPGCFSRVSSLSSLGDLAEETSLAKKNALATITIDTDIVDKDTSYSAKDKDGSKAVTFACSPELAPRTPPAPPAPPSPPAPPPQACVEDTPLVFSRCSSPSSLSGCSVAGPMDEQGSLASEISRLTSGCISPSELPDSPGHSVPQSPRAHARLLHAHHDKTPPTPPEGERSVFEERVSTFRVEHTPAHLSTATSLSSLTIDDEPPHRRRPAPSAPATQVTAVSPGEATRGGRHRAVGAGAAGDRTSIPSAGENATDRVVNNRRSEGGVCAPAQDTCRAYYTEDTPARLSHAGSDSDLSALSLETGGGGGGGGGGGREDGGGGSSDSSNLSDTGEDLLNECIQRGIAGVVKNGVASNGVDSCSPVPQYASRDQLYRSLPAYLRASTETVTPPRAAAISPERACRRELSSDESPPPPLPPKPASGVATARPPPPPRRPAPAPAPAASAPPAASPPLSLGSDDERIFNQAVQLGIHQLKEGKRESRDPGTVSHRDKLQQVPTNLARTDSLSSLSIDSFGSTDREIFEECVKVGLSKVNPGAKFALDSGRQKAHSAERVLDEDHFRHGRRHHKSLERSDKISGHRPRAHPERVALQTARSGRERRHEEAAGMTRASHSYHGDTAAHSLAHHSRRAAPRHRDDGPPSLPLHSEGRSRLERSNSLSSLSGDSFGSTDKEVFERCVRLGMAKPKGRDDAPAERETHRSRRRRSRSELAAAPARPPAGALERMTGEEDSRDRALLEEMIARGAGELRPPPKNVPAPSAARAPADGTDAASARTPRLSQRTTSTPKSGSDYIESDDTQPDTADEVLAGFDATIESCEMEACSDEHPTDGSDNTTLESAVPVDMDRSNEYPAASSANTTFESETKDILDQSNESYADVFDGSAWSDIGSPPAQYNCATLTRSNNKKPQWTEIEVASDNREKSSEKSPDTWNDNTCPDDITFPTISGSVPIVASFKSDAADASTALPDLLEESIGSKLSFPGPDLTDRLNDERHPTATSAEGYQQNCNTEPTQEDPARFGSMSSSTMIEREAAELAARLKNGFYFQGMETSAHSFDLDSIKPPSNMGSLVSLSVSTNLEETPKKRQKNRKKSLPVSLMVKRALTNSMTYHSSSEHLDSCPASILDNVKPPSELEHLDMESSIISVSSIVSEVVEHRGTIPVVFDFEQPISGFSLLTNFNNPLNDLDHVNPPSLFDEMVESTMEFEPTTAMQVLDNGVSDTLNLLTDIASGSENCSPLPSDLSSVETTPKRARNPKYLTPKEKRQLSKERYQTYTIADEGTEITDIVTHALVDDFGSDLTLESDSRSEDYITAQSEQRPRRKISAKQRRQEDRARYQTQTVNICSLLTDSGCKASSDPEIEDLRKRLAAKKTIRQRRLEDAERFRTRTIEDVPPSPTYVTSDANFENIETTTGYDSLSSAEFNHQQITDERAKDSDERVNDSEDIIKYSNGNLTDVQADSGTNDDDFELNTTQMQTYTRSFRNYLPVIESPSAVDICIVNNLKNIELSASYRRTPTYSLDAMRPEPPRDVSADRESDDISDSEPEAQPVRVKPKIIKPTQVRREYSLDSNGSCDEPTAPKAVRGRRKPAYVSPYKRNIPKSPTRTVTTKSTPVSKVQGVVRPAHAKPLSAPKSRAPIKPTAPSRIPNNTSPKTTTTAVPPKQLNPHKVPPPQAAVRPLPIERQGTFTKEESTVLPNESISQDKKCTVPSRLVKASTSVKANINTSPSRLPQPKSATQKPPLRKTDSHEVKSSAKRPAAAANRASLPAMKNSPSNQSLQSNDSTKTVTVASRGVSRHSSASSVNSPSSKCSKDATSKIASLWRRVEQSKQKVVSQPDRRVWIDATEAAAEAPKLIRSSTFEGQPTEAAPVAAAPKTKSSIAIRMSQIPSSRFGGRAGPSRPTDRAATAAGPSRNVPKVFVRKQLNNHEVVT